MVLKIFGHPLSQPARSVLIFARVNAIPYEDVLIDLMREKQKTEEYEKLNPFKKVPMIDHDGFRLTESVAILRYMARTFPVPDHWYPKNSKVQAKVDAYMEWQHLNLRTYGTLYFFETYVAAKNKPINEKRAASFQKGMERSMDEIASIWLKDSPFLGGNEVSIADLLATTELEQPGMGGYDVKTYNGRLKEYMEKVQAELNPHYDEVHQLCHKIKKKALEKV